MSSGSVAEWIDALRADLVFGWRQLAKNPVSSASAILSLGLAVGACISAFRLTNALLLRPLPVANADRLYSIGHAGFGPGGDFRISDSSEYPLFRHMREAVRDSAELIAVSYADRVDVTYGSDEEMEKASRQYVSGWMFREFGLRAEAGRLLTEADDQVPGAHPYAVISHAYWTRRFGRDTGIVGRTVRIGDVLFEIIGVAGAPFTGLETGTVVDFFVPAMMNPYVTRSDASWFRPFAVLKPGVQPGTVAPRLQRVLRGYQETRAREFTNQSKLFIERFLNQTVVLEGASSGVSGLQRQYSRPLMVLAVFAGLLLMIACANVANLMAVRMTTRSREMALRISIGAGQFRLVQLVLIESLWLGFLAVVAGSALTGWATPFLIERISPSDTPASLLLTTDWRVLSFSASLTLVVTFLFGLMPALRASSVRPATSLRGGEEIHEHQRTTFAVIGLQTAFCVVVLLAAGLFVRTLERLVSQPLGFSPERLLAVETRSVQPRPPQVWDQAAAHLRTLPGVQSVGIASWPLLSDNGTNGTIWVDGEATDVLAYFLPVSPEWRSTMGITLLDGRDFRRDDVSPGVALVNEAFVRQCLGGRHPVGRYFVRSSRNGNRFQVVGVVRDARYRNLREPITPTAYIPAHTLTSDGDVQRTKSAAFMVRLTPDAPGDVSALLRREVLRAQPELRVSNLRSQTELISRHTVRERLLVQLALFFSGIGLVLVSVGLYGVVESIAFRRRREIGIRLAIGAPARDIVWRVTAATLCVVVIGAFAGIFLGVALGNFASTILYEVKPADVGVLTTAIVLVLMVALTASLPAIFRALRTDPVSMLRSE